MSGTEIKKMWFEVLLRRRQDWIPSTFADVLEEAYHTTDFFATSAEFDNNVFQLMHFVTEATDVLPRSFDMFDLLHVCETRPGANGSRALLVKTFIVVPTHEARLFQGPKCKAHTAKAFPDITIVELQKPWAVSGRLNGFKRPL